MCNKYYVRSALMRDPDKSVGFLVGDVARLLRRNFDRRAQRLGLSQAQWRVLAYLSRQEGVNQVTLADRLEILPITLVRLLDRLQASGLIDRRPDPHDRRASQLYLTTKAQPLLARMWSLAAKTREEALADLPNQQREMFINTLRRLRRNLLEVESTANRSVKVER